MSNPDSSRRAPVHFLVIVAAVFLCWGNTYSFFWRDEWTFLSDLRSVDIAWFFRPFNGHIKPLFKALYFLEVHVFGINTVFYLLTNLFVYAIAVYGLRLVFLRVSTPSTRVATPEIVASALAVLVVAHPTNHNHLLWSFQVSQSLFMLFQVWAVLCFIRFIASGKSSDFWSSILLITCQNYSFGNGLFFSLLFATCTLLFGTAKKTRAALLYLLLFCVTIAVQVAGNPNGLVDRALQQPSTVIVGIFRLLDVSIARTFSIADLPSNRLPFVSLGVFIAFVAYGYSREYVNKLYLTIFSLWFLLNSLSIPIARPGLSQFPSYYSVMGLMPLALCAWTIVGNRMTTVIERRPRRTLVAAVAVLAMFYVVDVRMSYIFSRRNALNEQYVKDSIRNDDPYRPYDDPYFVEGEGFRVKDVKDVYLYWRSRTAILVVPQYLP
jgi:hypothetical protein